MTRIFDPYDKCKVCEKWHYTHADERHPFELDAEPYGPPDPIFLLEQAVARAERAEKEVARLTAELGWANKTISRLLRRK